MYVYGQLKKAQLENTIVDLSLAPVGLLWFNTVLGQMKISNGTLAINILANDGHCVFGTSATASENTRLHKGAAGVLQFVKGDDVTVENTLSTSLSKLSFQFESYPTASLPAAGAAGRAAWDATTGKLVVDNGTSWDTLASGNAIGIIPKILYENLVAGDLVNIINDGGTSKIQKMDGLDPITLKTGVDFEAGDTRYISSCYDASSGKLVIAYVDNGDSDKGKVIVGTFDANNVLTFGAPTVFNNAATSYVKIISVGAKFIIAFRDIGNANNGTAIAGEVTGTSVNLGTEAVFKAAATNSIQLAYSAFTGHGVVTYLVDADTTHLYARTIYISSGLVLSGGGEVSRVGVAISANNALFAPRLQSKVFASFVENSINGFVVITVGDFGDVNISANFTYGYTPISRMFEMDNMTGYFGISALATLSELDHYTLGTGAPVLVDNSFTPNDLTSPFSTNAVCTYDSKRTCAIVYHNGSALNKLHIADVTWGHIFSTFYSTDVTFAGTPNSTHMDIVYIPNREVFVVLFANASAANKGVAVVGGMVTFSDAIGILQTAGAAGNTRNIAVEGGISTIHSGLVIGAAYYAQPDGTLSTTKSPYPIGRALSATELLVTKRP